MVVNLSAHDSDMLLQIPENQTQIHELSVASGNLIGSGSQTSERWISCRFHDVDQDHSEETGHISSPK